MKKRKTANPKRRLISEQTYLHQKQNLRQLAQQVSYGGNSEHKRNPGDFGLAPPLGPRPGKILCDDVNIFKRASAKKLLQEGICRGLVCEQCKNKWPKNVWAVANNGTPLEAQLDNEVTGSYHGYPMLSDDPFREEVLKRWNATKCQNSP